MFLNPKASSFLQHSVKYNISYRNYPGGDSSKKVIEEIKKKCIGAGCESTRPFFPSNVKNDVNQEVLPCTSTIKPKEVEKRNPDSGLKNDPNTEQRIKQIQQPVTYVGDKFTENSRKTQSMNPKAILEKDPYMQPVESKNIKKAIEQPLSYTDFHNHSSFTETFLDSSNIVDDGIGVPALPIYTPLMSLEMKTELQYKASLINTPSANNVLNENLTKLESSIESKKQEAIVKEYFYEKNDIGIEERRIFEKMLDLSLLLIEDTDQGKLTGGYKLTQEFFRILAQISDKQPLDSLSTFTLNQESLNAGVLQVIELYQKNSVFLYGIQSHLVVAIQTKDNQYIVIGYLTSSKANTVFLSEHQLLSDNKGKVQRFKPIHPLVVDKEYIKIHHEGTAYISFSDIKKKLFEDLENKINMNEMCYKYIPKGIDLKTLEKVIELKIKEDDDKILKALVKYEKDLKQAQNQLNEDDLDKWIKNKNDTLGKMHKCTWPEYAEHLKKKL